MRIVGLRVYLDDPWRVKRLLLPTKSSTTSAGGGGGKSAAGRGEASSPSLMNLLMGVKVLQQAIIDLLLDIMVECCQPSEGKKGNDAPAESKRGGAVEANNVSGVLLAHGEWRVGEGLGVGERVKLAGGSHVRFSDREWRGNRTRRLRWAWEAGLERSDGDEAVLSGGVVVFVLFN